MSASSPVRASRRITPARVALASAVAVVGVSLTGMAVFAGLNAVATNTTAQSVASGTMSLTLAAGSGSAGFSTGISGLAPGDTVDRYVDLTNGGTIAGTALTLGASDSSATTLSTDATKGLHVTVTQCTTAWVSGTCGDQSPAVLADSVPLATLTSTPTTLVSGAIAAGAVLHLQVAVQLPDITETVTNGQLPTGTIQGKSASITWTFTEQQRTAATTSS